MEMPRGQVFASTAWDSKALLGSRQVGGGLTSHFFVDLFGRGRLVDVKSPCSWMWYAW